ncbi:MAG TPA: tryptophan synthase subunit alpha, partial [Actinomycetota bacterium]|nr:tryptophan synthase subunit alpha [Actinomycetota bacterium]
MGTPELETTLNRAVADGKKLLVTYLTAGLPSSKEFLELVTQLSEVSDAIEVGIPFSDPVMDGPVIQDASTKAIEAGVTPAVSLDLLEEAAAQVSTPLVVMTYFNPIHRMGEAQFADRLAGAG